MNEEYIKEITEAQRKNLEYIQAQYALSAYYNFVAERWKSGPTKIIPVPAKEETPSE